MTTQAPTRVYEEINQGFGTGDICTTEYQEIVGVTQEDVSNLLALPWIKLQDNIKGLEGKVIVLTGYEASLLKETIASRVKKVLKEKEAA